MKKLAVAAALFAFLVAGCSNGGDSGAADYENVDSLIAEAGEAAGSEDYENALKTYAKALSANPISVDAQLGMAECQIALGDYGMAETNLSAALSVDPNNEEIYDLYVKLGDASGEISYVRPAVSSARIHNVEGFLKRIPDTPALSQQDGKYDSKIQVEITAGEGCQIYVTEIKDSNSLSYTYNDYPIPITSGETELQVCAVKDGIPSDVVTAHYNCEYDPTEVTFTDHVVELMARAALELPSGPIMDTDCESVTDLAQYNIRMDGMESEEYEKLKVETLNDLDLFPNLQSLDIDNVDKISDFSPLARCRKLMMLELQDCGLKDISFVGSMPSLQVFYASGNKIRDVSPLSSCKNLQVLDITGNPAKDFGALKDLDLTDLSIDYGQMPDLSFLSNWQNLENLRISECGGQDLSLLGELTQLKYLYLYAGDEENVKPIGDISFLQNLAQLESLMLDGLSDYSQLGYVKGLSGLTYLSTSTLDYSDMPDELYEELKQSLPGCDIY